MTEQEQAVRPRRGRPRAESEAPAENGERRPRSARPRNQEERETHGAGLAQSSNRPTTVASGWKAFEQKRSQGGGDFVKNFTLPEEPTLVKILDEAPFAVFDEHWLNQVGQGRKKSYLCIGQGCPLCAIGEKRKVYALFNLLDLSDPSDPQVKPWKVSQTVGDLLERYSTDSKTSPLNREDLYWQVFKTGNKNRTQTNLLPVKARDLADDWDFDPPLTDEELSEFTLLTEEDVLVWNSKSELRDLADELEG